jgi:hypothetical protein
MASITDIPRLQQHGKIKQLVVNGKPFLMLGGELQNSSLSSAEYMSEVWPKMAATNVNTLLGSVTWEMIEPTEGSFDFRELDEIVLGARKHGLHLILLWFGSFKNGKSPDSTLFRVLTRSKEDPHTHRHGLKQTPTGSRVPNYERRGE